MSRFYHFLCVALLALFVGRTADARPVSYPEGWTIMQQNNGDFSSAHVHYSPTFQDSFGIYAERNWANDWQFTGVQYNRLVKRWNTSDSQANLYFKLGAGQADAFGDSEESLAGFVDISADWETRRWFLAYDARAYDLGFDQDFRQFARVGVAPYIGDYGDLHTWLMVQVDHDPESDTPVTATPLIRFFYDVQLLEIGYTPETDRFMLNWIIRL
ncbi:MAG: hypothetical protein AAGI14_07520 [Pseudomonadota bacterium]